MTLVLDAGALIALERADRDVLALLKGERVAGRVSITHGGVIGQVWRGGEGRQANLARAIPSMEVAGLDDQLGRRCGILLGRALQHDVVDAAVVLLARDGDMILTSDPHDLERLARTADLHVDLVSV